MDNQPPPSPETPPPVPAPSQEKQSLSGSKAADIVLAIFGSLGLLVLLGRHAAFLISGIIVTLLALIAWRIADARTAVFFKTWLIVWGVALVLGFAVIGACMAAFKW